MVAILLPNCPSHAHTVCVGLRWREQEKRQDYEYQRALFKVFERGTTYDRDDKNFGCTLEKKRTRVTIEKS